MLEESDIIYVEKEFFKGILCKIVIITLIVLAMSMFNLFLGKKLIIIVNIVLIFSIMLLSMTTFTFSKNKFFTLSSVCYIIIGILKIIELVEENKLSGVVGQNVLEMSKVMEAFYVFIMTKYLRNLYLSYKKQQWDKKIDFFIGMLLSLAVVLNIVFQGNYNKFFYRTLVVMIFFIIIYYVLNFRERKENKLNYFMIASIALFISSIFNFIELFSSLPLVVAFLSEVFCFFAYIIIHLCLNYKLLEKPSENLFVELHNRNKQLMIINKNINIQNEHLEKIQMNLRNKDDIFKSIYKNIQLPLIIVKENRKILYANEKFKEVIGIDDIKKIINKNIFEFIDVVKIRNIIEKDIKEKSVIENIKLKSLKESDYIYNINILKTNENNIIFIFYDVTEEKKVEAIKKEYEKKMLEEKIKNDFLSNISHDIKTPINVIYSATQLQKVLIKEKKIEELKKYNNISKENILTITRLANNLIDSSKLSSKYLNANMQLVNIVELIEDTCNKFVEYIKNKNLNFYFDTEEEEIYIKCDVNFIERIIINIISNSIKYTVRGEITVGIFLKGNKVLIEFSDTGEGIKEELISSIFEKYSIEKEASRDINKNTGIGLYVVDNLMKLQNGKIKLNSQKGIGTTVILEFFVEAINEDLSNVIM